MRDGFLDGRNLKPTHLVELELVRTKHSEATRRHKHVRAYARSKKGKILFGEGDILNNPKVGRQFLPSCYEAGISIDYKVNGDWRDLPRFEPTSLELMPFSEED